MSQASDQEMQGNTQPLNSQEDKAAIKSEIKREQARQMDNSMPAPEGQPQRPETSEQRGAGSDDEMIPVVQESAPPVENIQNPPQNKKYN